MYLPESFNESDRERILELMDQYGFATLVSWTGADRHLPEPMVSHLPLLVERRPDGPVLVGHFARACSYLCTRRSTMSPVASSPTSTGRPCACTTT